MKFYKYILIVLVPFIVISCGLLGEDEEPEIMKAFVAFFEMDKSECVAPCEVGFTNYSIDVDECEWDFDDGSLTDISCNTVHTFTEAGEYSVTLKVTNREGNTATSTQIVTVTAPPTTDGHPFSGVKYFSGVGNDAIRNVIEVADGFIMLTGNHSGQGPLSTLPTSSALVKVNYSGEVIFTEFLPSGVVGLDMIKTLNDRIFIAGIDGNFGTAFEIDKDFNIIRTFVSDLLGSAYTSIDHNGQNQIFVAGYQIVDGVKGALVEKLASGFTFINRWVSFSKTTNSNFDNVVVHGNSVFLTAYLAEENKTVIYNLLGDLSDANSLVILEESNVVGLEVDEDRVYAAALRPMGFHSQLTEYSHDLQLLDDNLIAIGGLDVIYPVDIQLVDGYYLIPSIIINSGETCLISSALQRVCTTTGSQCASNIVTCPENQTTMVITQIIELENGEYFAVGTSSDSDNVFGIAYLMLDDDFNMK